MNTWQLAAASEDYQRALKATEGLTKDERAVGFIKPHEHSLNLADTNIQRQNNTIIHLQIQILEELRSTSEKIQNLSSRISTLERGKTFVTLPEDTINQLSEQLKGTTFGERKGPVKGKGQGPFLVWK